MRRIVQRTLTGAVAAALLGSVGGAAFVAGARAVDSRPARAPREAASSPAGLQPQTPSEPAAHSERASATPPVSASPSIAAEPLPIPEDESSGGLVTIPDLIDARLATALEQLWDLGLGVAGYKYLPADAAQYIVTDLRPTAGSRVSAGSVVEVWSQHELDHAESGLHDDADMTGFGRRADPLSLQGSIWFAEYRVAAGESSCHSVLDDDPRAPGDARRLFAVYDAAGTFANDREALLAISEAGAGQLGSGPGRRTGCVHDFATTIVRNAARYRFIRNGEGGETVMNVVVDEDEVDAQSRYIDIAVER